MSNGTGTDRTYANTHMFSKTFDVSEAIWALKAVFYAVDHGNAGLVQVEDLLTALSDASWPPQRAPTSNLCHLRQTTDNVRVASGAGTTVPCSEAHGDEEVETLLSRLSRLGVVGGRSGSGGDGDDAQGGAGLVHYIRHLLAPPVSRLDVASRTDMQHPLLTRRVRGLEVVVSNSVARKPCPSRSA